MMLAVMGLVAIGAGAFMLATFEDPSGAGFLAGVGVFAIIMWATFGGAGHER